MKNPFDTPERAAYRETVAKFVAAEIKPHVDEWDEAGAILLRPSRTPEGADTGSRSMYARAVLLYYGVLPAENHSFRLDDIGGGVFALSLDEPLPKSRSRRGGSHT